MLAATSWSSKLACLDDVFLWLLVLVLSETFFEDDDISDKPPPFDAGRGHCIIELMLSRRMGAQFCILR